MGHGENWNPLNLDKGIKEGMGEKFFFLFLFELPCNLKEITFKNPKDSFL